MLWIIVANDQTNEYELLTIYIYFVSQFGRLLELLPENINFTIFTSDTDFLELQQGDSFAGRRCTILDPKKRDLHGTLKWIAR